MLMEVASQIWLNLKCILISREIMSMYMRISYFRRSWWGGTIYRYIHIYRFTYYTIFEGGWLLRVKVHVYQFLSGLLCMYMRLSCCVCMFEYLAVGHYCQVRQGDAILSVIYLYVCIFWYFSIALKSVLTKLTNMSVRISADHSGAILWRSDRGRHHLHCV